MSVTSVILMRIYCFPFYFLLVTVIILQKMVNCEGVTNPASGEMERESKTEPEPEAHGALSSTRSLAGNNTWRKIQEHSQLQPLRLSGNQASTILIKFQRRNLPNKVIHGLTPSFTPRELEGPEHQRVLLQKFYLQRLRLRDGKRFSSSSDTERAFSD